MTFRQHSLRAAIAPLRWWPQTRRADDKAMIAAQNEGLVDGEHVTRAVDGDPKGPLKQWSLTPAGCALLAGQLPDMAKHA